MADKVWVQLTDAEVEQRAKELARTFEQIDEVETARKDAMADFRRQLRLLNVRQRELAQAVKTRGELREDDRQRKLFEGLTAHAEKGLEDTTITLRSPGGREVTATAADMKRALKAVRGAKGGEGGSDA